MLAVIFALAPVFAAIALGHGLKRLNFLPEEHWAAFDRMNYFVFFPALLIRAVGTADFSGEMVMRVGGVLLATVFVMAGALILSRRFLPISGAAFSSLFQCSVRWNGFVALASALTLLGPEGLAIVAIGIAVMVPTVNIMSVLVLTHGSAATPMRLARLLATNPLIIGCAVGILLNVTGIGLPGPTDDFARLLGNGALALGLLSVGAGLNFAAVSKAGWVVTAGTVLKLLVKPALAFGFASWMGLEGVTLSAVMLIASVPTATSGYVLARQLGGDAPLMAAFVTATSLAAMVTMPLWLALVS